MDSNGMLYLARNSPKMMISSAISKLLSQHVSWNTGLRLLDNYIRVGHKNGYATWFHLLAWICLPTSSECIEDYWEEYSMREGEKERDYLITRSIKR